MVANPPSLLASYATFKELYNSPKYNSPYQILAEFIKYIITSNSKNTFTITEIKRELEDVFGFVQPYDVIKTALKRLPGIELNNGEYTVQCQEIKRNSSFDKYIQTAEEKNNDLIEQLLKFAQEKDKNFIFKRDALSQEFVAFLLDEEGDQKYREIIGAFIIANQTNDLIKQQMIEIRAGSIIFSGLSYNITEYGSIRDPLTLFLDTEILFDIMGLNGELYQKLAMDFYKLVSIANLKQKVISLRYFSEVEKDINCYFGRAEHIVSGKKELLQRPAMQAIIHGCTSVSDVKDKQTDFYQTLKHHYDIQSDKKDNYYTDQDEKYELETEEINGLSIDERYEGVRYCSKINKLRRGLEPTDYFKSQYLFVTQTKRVLEINNVLLEKHRQDSHGKCVDYAISLNHITNLLWCKLSFGFSKPDFPQSIDVVTKARVVLSGYITQGILSTYNEIQEQYKSGKLSKEIAVSRIIALRNKTSLPEDITEDNLENDLSFDEKALDVFTEDIAKKELQIIEKNKIIEELKQKLWEQENKESLIKLKRICRRNRLLFVWHIAWRVIVFLLVSLAIYYTSKYFHYDLFGLISVLAIAISFTFRAWRFFKAELLKYRDSIQDAKKNIL